MLPARHRLRRSTDFQATTKAGLRAGGDAVVVHLLLAAQADATEPVRVGFVVSKAVGGSVQRHQVVRRLREVTRTHLSDLPLGARVVVRALAPAATASYDELEQDFAGALARVLRKAEKVRSSERAEQVDGS